MNNSIHDSFLNDHKVIGKLLFSEGSKAPLWLISFHKHGRQWWSCFLIKKKKKTNYVYMYG